MHQVNELDRSNTCIASNGKSVLEDMRTLQGLVKQLRAIFQKLDMASELSKNYAATLQDLKEKIRQARLRATIAVNNELLQVYWEIGATISKQEQAEGRGTKTVERLAKDLRFEFQDMKGLSPRNLRYMRDFALAYPQFAILQHSVAKSEADENQPSTILQRSVAKLPWGHNCILLDKVKLPEERAFYAQKAVQNGWTRDMLVNQIESSLFKRQGAIINNFGLTLPSYETELALQLFIPWCVSHAPIYLVESAFKIYKIITTSKTFIP